MKLMKTEDAVGQVLCHDITQIIKGVTKDAVFRKGHIITEEDIPVLLSVGKDNIYIWEKDDTMLHENEAAQILYDMCKNDHMHPSDVKEGKIELIADCDGLLKVDREKLKKVNSLGEMMIATRHGDTYVKKGDKLAGTRIIPLVIKKEKMETAQAVCSDGPILTLKPFHKKKFAVLTTGNEVYYHRIEDTFTGRQDAAGDQKYRSTHRFLRRAGAAGSHVPSGVCRKRNTDRRPAGMRHVFETDDF